MYERALRGKENALGLNHTSTLDTVNNLGLLYADQGKLYQAEEMYKRALRGYEKALGLDHKSTLSAVNNLGLLYAEYGKLDQAEEMYERALRGYKKWIGPQNITSYRPAINAMSALGQLAVGRGHLNTAKVLLEQAAEGLATLLGPSSIEVKHLHQLLSSVALIEAEKKPPSLSKDEPSTKLEDTQEPRRPSKLIRFLGLWKARRHTGV